MVMQSANLAAAAPAPDASEGQFRAAVESILDGFAILSAVRDAAGAITDFRYAYINSAGCRLDGRDCAAYSGHTLHELWPAHKVAGLFNTYAAVVETGQPFSGESACVPNGEPDAGRSCDRRVTRLGDGVAVVWRDVTETRRIQGALQTANIVLEKTFEALDQAVFVVDPATRAIISCNPAAERIFGYRRDEIIGRNTEFLHVDRASYAEFGRRLAEAGAAEQAFRIEHQLKRKSGEVFYAEIAVARIAVHDGQPAVNVSVIRDITRHKQMEEALRASEERHRSLFENSLDAILLTTPNGDILAANPEAQRMLGRTEEELRQVGRAGVVDATDPRLAAALDERARTGKARAELTYVRKDGTTFAGEVTSAVFRDRDGALRTSMFIRDITERTTAEERIGSEAARAAALVRTAARLNAQLDLDVVLLAICEETMRALNVEGCLVLLYERERRALTPAALCGLPAEAIHGMTPMSLALFQKYFQGREPLVMTDVQAAPDLVNADLRTHHDVRTAATASMVRDSELIGTLSAFTLGQTRVFHDDDLTLLQGLAHQASLAISNARLFEQVQEQGRRLRALASQMSEIEENERHALARELHDQVGQNLTALAINLSILRGQLSDEAAQRSGARLDDSLALLEQTTERIRDVMADLRPPALDDYGLLAALRWYGAQFSQRTGVRAVVQGDDLTPRPSAAVEITLFRIAQEALTNVAKHAGAGLVTVSLEADDVVRLTISDDGVGFEPAQVMGPAAQRGWGLVNMLERARSLGGDLRIESCPGRGTDVIVEVSR